jgi:hypothetical protein
MEAQVLDGATWEPVEGVIVIAQWMSKGGSIEASGTGYLQVMEAVTDHDGRFRFPGWGPEWAGFIRDGTPLLSLFKDGYDSKGFDGTQRNSPAKNGVQMLNSAWNGGKIPLVKFMGTRDEYISDVHSYADIVVRHIVNGECMWKKIPNVLIELTRLKKEFIAEEKRGAVISSNVYSLVDITYPPKDCGDPEATLKEYIK